MTNYYRSGASKMILRMLKQKKDIDVIKFHAIVKWGASETYVENFIKNVQSLKDKKLI